MLYKFNNNIIAVFKSNLFSIKLRFNERRTDKLAPIFVIMFSQKSVHSLPIRWNGDVQG